jgi:hypothetical protein
MCSSSLTVNLWAPFNVYGAASDMPCKHGEPIPEQPAAPAPPSGEALQLPERKPVKPVRVQPTPPVADEVPWFMRGKVPAKAGV